jgi:hypothetical protein
MDETPDDGPIRRRLMLGLLLAAVAAVVAAFANLAMSAGKKPGGRVGNRWAFYRRRLARKGQ